MNSQDINDFSLRESARKWLEGIEVCRTTCTRFRILIEEYTKRRHGTDEEQFNEQLAWCLDASLPPKRSECASDEDWLRSIMTWMEQAKMHVLEGKNLFAMNSSSDVAIAVRSVEELAKDLHAKALGIFDSYFSDR